MKIKQISVMLENKTGKLADVTKLLAEKKVDLRAISIADTTDYGILRIVVDDPEETCKLLSQNGYLAKITDVFSVAVPDAPGGMNAVVNKLFSNGIGIEYAYALPLLGNQTAYMILRVDDTAKAESILD